MDVESWYFRTIKCLNLGDFQETLWYPLNIPTPTPAPDRGGPVACLGGPVACLWWSKLSQRDPNHLLFGMALFNEAGLEMGRQKINPKTQVRHIWPNNNAYFIPECGTLEANLKNQLII